MRDVIYDAGVLVAAERSNRDVWAEHRVRLEDGILPVVPTPVVAQVSRSPKQAQLRRFLRGCEVVSFHEADAHQVGELLRKSRTSDVVDATVVALAVERRADIQTSDPTDIRRLAAAAPHPIRVVEI